MKDSDLPSQLVRFGLTRQEADLFVLLSRIRNSGSGGVSGSGIAALAMGERVRTYQILQRLADLGLVQVEPGRPKRYAAVSPQVGIRRLIALQETRLTELSLMEAEVAEGLRTSSPVSADEGEGEGKEKWNATLLHGISNIQTMARRAMEGQDLRIIVNDESEDHVFTTVRYMSRKPRSARVIFATTDKRQKTFEPAGIKIGGYTYRIRVFHGELPTIVLTGRECLMLFYASRSYRPKPLSPLTTRTVASDCILVDSPRFVAQAETIFEAFWNASE
jgi:hypothetical protein